jgi:hypothetical protein
VLGGEGKKKASLESYPQRKNVSFCTLCVCFYVHHFSRDMQQAFSNAFLDFRFCSDHLSIAHGFKITSFLLTKKNSPLFVSFVRRKPNYWKKNNSLAEITSAEFWEIAKLRIIGNLDG